MRAVVQRVKASSVTIKGSEHSSITKGILILLGIKQEDNEHAAAYLAEKCAALRIFDDDEGKMNLSVRDVGGEVLIVSQFTLYGDTQRGNRPSFGEAAKPELAESLYDQFVLEMKKLLGSQKVQSGVFRAMMDVSLVNDGPVTLIVESKELP
jgi:D-tyrosyl-tRNA(Tyr) deacylase